MKKTLIFPLIFVGFWGIGCGGDGGARRGNQTAAYETVQEGSAAGVTSTIQGPGETLPPITGTNADTTTAFTLDPNVAAAAPPPNVASGAGTLAGTLPSQPAYPPPMTSASQPQPQRTYTPPQQPQRTYSPTPQPQPQQQQPRPVEQEQPQQQPPATDTTATTAQPQQQPQQQQQQPAPQPPPTNTNPPVENDEGDDAEEEPPPPPTTTDTRGN